MGTLSLSRTREGDRVPRLMNWVSSYWDLVQRSAVISTLPEAYEWMYGDSNQAPPDDGPLDADLPVIKESVSTGDGELGDM